MSSIKKDILQLSLPENQTIIHQFPSNQFNIFVQNEQNYDSLQSTTLPLQRRKTIQTLLQEQSQLIEGKQCNDGQIPTFPQKSAQSLLSFIISIIIPMANSTLLASIITHPKDNYTIYKSWTCSTISLFMFIYFTIETIAKFGANKYLQYYFHADRLLPAILTSSFAYFAMTSHTVNLYGYEKVGQITFALWVFTMAGNLRVSLKEYSWNHLHILISKLAYLYCGTATLYWGAQYIQSDLCSQFGADGGHLNDLVILFLLVTVQAFYQHYQFIYHFYNTERKSQTAKAINYMENKQNVEKQ